MYIHGVSPASKFDLTLIPLPGTDQWASGSKAAWATITSSLKVLWCPHVAPNSLTQDVEPQEEGPLLIDQALICSLPSCCWEPCGVLCSKLNSPTSCLVGLRAVAAREELSHCFLLSESFCFQWLPPSEVGPCWVGSTWPSILWQPLSINYWTPCTSCEPLLSSPWKSEWIVSVVGRSCLWLKGSEKAFDLGNRFSASIKSVHLWVVLHLVFKLFSTFC